MKQFPYLINAKTISTTPQSQPRFILRAAAAIFPSFQPNIIEPRPAAKVIAESTGRLILPSPALTPVTTESAERAIASAAASFAEMLLELSLSAAVPSKRRIAGFLVQEIMLLKKFLKRLKIPKAISSRNETVLQRASGTASFAAPARATETLRKRVPVKLIMTAERNGSFIPALPIPIAAAKPSIDTAVTKSRDFIIYRSYLFK